MPAPSGLGGQVGYRPAPQNAWNARSCYACKRPVVETAIVCPSCGTALGSPKSKGAAILLAVFLSFWTWVYTYKRDAAKFWIGLVLGLVGFALTLVVVGWLLLFAIWLWAVIDTATKDEQYYVRFPNA